MPRSTKYVAIYVRVSSRSQDTRSQVPDLEQWIESYADGRRVRWFRESASGLSMDRPQWNRLGDAIRTGRVDTVVVWRLDRLGRTVSGLSTLFEELRDRRIGFVSIKDGIDLSTPAGRLMANVLASVAAYETEVRGERVAAGQAAARANGKRWGGSKRGVRKKVTPTQERAIRRMRDDGEPIAAIARAVGLSRPTIYSVLAK